MSMQTLTILQFIGVLAAYLGMTVLLPAFVFYRKVSEERFCVRFLIYLVIGNVYLINLVLVLQLLHISYWFTLFLGTVLPVLWTIARVHNTTVKDGVLGVARGVNSFLGGTMGGKLLFSKILRFLWHLLKTGVVRIFRSIKENFFDWIGTVGTIMLILWLYGNNMIRNLGYCTSDIPVHNYWINAMGKNNVFVAGVYPYGFHSVVYYIHKMFGFQTFVILRTFHLVQTLIIHMVLLAFLKACCRTKYSPYIAMIMYILADVWHLETYKRYASSLPQEFGMIFILPAIYFLFVFFEDRKRESGKKGWKVHSTSYLVFFGLSFSATLAVHFYNTMIAGIFCIGVGIGFLGLLFRKPYFGRIMVTGILSIMLAVLPMALAVAVGKPLEGSLRWGMSIISGTSESSGSSSKTQQNTTEEDSKRPASGTAGQTTAGEGMQTSGDNAALSSENISPPESQVPLKVRLKSWLSEKWERTVQLEESLEIYLSVLVLAKATLSVIKIIISFTAILGIVGLINLFVRKTRFYGSILLSITFCILSLYAMLMAPRLGIPALMDQNRCSVYLAYILAAEMAFVADSLISLLADRIATKNLASMLSFGIVCLITGVLGLGGKYKEPLELEALQSNDAIICLTNILRDEVSYKFTICSANDELRMAEDYGYHYEDISLLQGMEGERVSEYLTIPTPRVYFFIEKIPLDYTIGYEGSGSRISIEGARRDLPAGSGLGVYMGRNRHTVMSKMYYWAKTFQEMYPNEMRIYYETDAFVCYVLEQNPYRLFDLSIDYGYNGTGSDE